MLHGATLGKAATVQGQHPPVSVKQLKRGGKACQGVTTMFEGASHAVCRLSWPRGNVACIRGPLLSVDAAQEGTTLQSIGDIHAVTHRCLMRAALCVCKQNILRNRSEPENDTRQGIMLVWDPKLLSVAGVKRSQLMGNVSPPTRPARSAAAAPSALPWALCRCQLRG